MPANFTCDTDAGKHSITDAVEHSISKWRRMITETKSASSDPTSTSDTMPDSSPDMASDDTECDTVSNSLTIDANANEVSYKLVSEIIINLTNSKHRPTRENIIEQFDIKGIAENIASELIISAIERELIYEYRYSKQICYRVKNNSLDDETNDIIIRDPIEHVSIQTESIDQTHMDSNEFVPLSEFNDFKAKLFAEIESLKLLPTINNTSFQQPFVHNDPPFLNEYIRSLLDRISFLENTLQSVLATQHENFNLLVKNASHDVSSKKLPLQSNLTPSQPIDRPDLQTVPSTSTAIASDQSNNDPATTVISKKSPSKPTNIANPPAAKKGKTKRKIVEIIGDSMLLGIKEKEMRQKHHVRVRPYSGAKTFDMINLAAITARRKPDACIMHVGSNDFNDESEIIDSVANMEEAFRYLQKESPATKISYSMTFLRHDKGNTKKVNQNIKELNEHMKVLCRRYGVDMITNYNITRTLLGKQGWHPNQDGKDVLTDNWLDYIYKL